MTKFSTTLHMDPGVAEDQVDEIGKAVLIEQARARKLTITGPVERTYDEFVVGVQIVSEGQSVIKHVPIGSPLAEGRTDPDARMVTWQADSQPITPDPAPVVVGVPLEGVHPARTAVATLPDAVVAAGGMIAFRHGLDSDAVTISVFDAQGATVAYEFAIDINRNEQQVLLLPGSAQIQAVIDVEETK